MTDEARRMATFAAHEAGHHAIPDPDCGLCVNEAADREAPKTIHMSIVQRASQRGDYHWFDADTLAWFGSRIEDTAYLSGDGEHAFFVTSEQDTSYPHPAWNGERRWSVRRCDLLAGRITTVGEFGDHPDWASADKRARSEALLHAWSGRL
jgi:hypothetical protein